MLFGVTAFAQKTAIKADQLPQKATELITRNYPLYNVEGMFVGNSKAGFAYEVTFAEGLKIEFNAEGEWTKMSNEFKPVGIGTIPQGINLYLQDRDESRMVVEVRKDAKTYTIVTRKGNEYVFDSKGNFIR